MDLAKQGRRPRLELKLRHHPDNLHALYRESEDPVERSRWHAIWLRFGAPSPNEPQEGRDRGPCSRGPGKWA
jgi:hypothetical protein